MSNAAETEGELELQSRLKSMEGKTISKVCAMYMRGPISAIAIHFTDGTCVTVQDHYHFEYGFMVRLDGDHSYNIHGQHSLGLISDQAYETELQIVAGQEALEAVEKAEKDKVERQKLYEELKQEFGGNDNGT